MECGECKFWDESDIHVEAGSKEPRYSTCHRNPPTAGGGGEALWPIVPEYEWCGEHVEERSRHKPAPAEPCAVCGLRTWRKFEHFKEAHPEFKMVRRSGSAYHPPSYSCGVCGQPVNSFAQLVEKHRHPEVPVSPS